MNIRFLNLPKGHYLRTEQGFFMLFASISSFVLATGLAYGLYLAPIHINNWLAEAILIGIFILSTRHLWIQTQKHNRDQAPPEETG